MSFFKKDKSAEGTNYAEADVQTQLARIIEQLGFLEKKIDALSQNQSRPRPFNNGRPGFGRSGGGHFSGGQHRENGGFRPAGGGFAGRRDNGHRSHGGGHQRPHRSRPQHGGHSSHGPARSHDPNKPDNFGNA